MGTIKSRFCHESSTEIGFMGRKPVSTFKKGARLYFNACRARALTIMLVLSISTFPQTALTQQEVSNNSYEGLLALFENWREFETPPLLDGAPDYTAATTARRHQELKTYQARLMSFDVEGWPVAQQVDWHLVRAEMNGMDFNIRVLQSWVRDPAYYTSVWTDQSDTPAHEGPTHHGLVELWTYDFPLDEQSEARLSAELKIIPPLLQQARVNLTGNARELWIGGIQNLRDQQTALVKLAAKTQSNGAEFKTTVENARLAMFPLSYCCAPRPLASVSALSPTPCSNRVSRSL